MGPLREDRASGRDFSQVDGAGRESAPASNARILAEVRGGKMPPRQPARGQLYIPADLNVVSTVLVSFGATVTFWSCSPSFSWTKAMV